MNMKKFFIILASLGFINCQGQGDEKVLYRINYKFIHLADTFRPDEPIIRNMTMDISDNISRFYLIIPKPPVTRPKPTLMPQPMVRKVAIGQPIAVVSSDPVANESLFQITSQKILVKLSTIALQDYIIEQELPRHKWKMHKEQKLIGDITCQKATTKYAGRQYTAWFAPSLPLSFGPWKLWGLPGLILEASDEKNQVQFLFAGITDPDGTLNSNSIGYRPVKITEAAYEKARQQFESDPAGATQATLAVGDDSKVAVYFQDSTGKFLSGEAAEKAIDAKRKRVINNPIELKKNDL
jgi:GLPGLI family protein